MRRGYELRLLLPFASPSPSPWPLLLSRSVSLILSAVAPRPLGSEERETLLSWRCRGLLRDLGLARPREVRRVELRLRDLELRDDAKFELLLRDRLSRPGERLRDEEYLRRFAAARLSGDVEGVEGLREDLLFLRDSRYFPWLLLGDADRFLVDLGLDTLRSRRVRRAGAGSEPRLESRLRSGLRDREVADAGDGERVSLRRRPDTRLSRPRFLGT